MSPALISFFVAVGASTWIYTKMQKYSGNNSKQSAIATAVAGVVIFILAFVIFKLILKT